MSGVFNYESLVHATAGATGSIFAMTCIYPLDNVKFRMQLKDKSLLDKTTLEALIYILKNEGIDTYCELRRHHTPPVYHVLPTFETNIDHAPFHKDSIDTSNPYYNRGNLYRGLRTELTTLGISSFVYFYAFHGLKSLLPTEKKLSAKTDLVISIAAGLINVCISSPLMVVNNRMKSTNHSFAGLLNGLIYIANTEGISALWSGFTSALILISNPAIHFTIYEALKRKSASKNATEFFIKGAVSKALATIITYPIQLAQTHQRSSNEYNVNTMLLLWLMMTKDGVGALYRGLEAKLLQTVLHAAIMFMTYEKIVMCILRLYKKHVVK